MGRPWYLGVLIVLPLVIFVVVITIYGFAQQNQLHVHTFFHLSDIHLDLQYDAAYGPASLCRPPSAFYSDSESVESYLSRIRIGGNDDNNPGGGVQNINVTYHGPAPFGKVNCDAPYPLFISTLNAMRTLDPNPQFIIITGDFVAHNVSDRRITLYTVKNATDTITMFFPNTIVYPMIGNDDCYPDYTLNYGPDYGYLDNLTAIWSNWLTPSAQETFRIGGYYMAQITPNTRLLALNTIYYSMLWETESGNELPTPDPSGQMEWLAEQLALAVAQDNRVIIAGHIPPGQNAYGSDPLWHPYFVRNYTDLISMPANQHAIILQLFAHFHRDEFRVFYEDPLVQNNPIGSFLLTGSITPLTGNNPSFRIMAWDVDARQVTTYDAYYADLFSGNKAGTMTWLLEYDFATAYQQPLLNVNTLAQLYQTLKTNADVYALWQTRRMAMYQKDTYVFFCAISTQSNTDYARCLFEGGINYPA